jgi:hypothetical protein
MFENAVTHTGDRTTPETRLWQAVIAKTMEEWVRGPLRYSRLAEQFLFSDDRDFQAVCSSAGMDPGYLRKRLQSIRVRGIQKQNSQPQTSNPKTTRRRGLKSLSLVFSQGADF